MATKRLSEIRAILMDEHADIRAQIEEARAASASSDTARQRACTGGRLPDHEAAATTAAILPAALHGGDP